MIRAPFGQANSLLVVVQVGLLVYGPITVILLLLVLTTRYRHLGLAVPSATIVFLYGGVVATSAEEWRIMATGVGPWCVGLLITVGQFTRTPRLLSRPTENGEEYTSGLLKVLDRYWWIKRGVQVANIAGLGLVVYFTQAGWASDTLTSSLPWFLFLLSATLCVWCWLRLFRPFVELCVEPVFRVLYRMRAFGPGVKRIPPLGPVLVIANHASWFDPLFLAEFIPRPITPMMTESFYKIWFLRPLLKNVFKVIVVRESAARREAPELQQAIDALDRGECVVLFPEGFLQRKVDVELRRFARGVWHILAARPDTPVVSCFIAGGWLTKFSWRNGPPGKNKRMDFRTPIRVGVSLPETVPAEILIDQLTTRIHLMNRVNAARVHVGLPTLPTFELPKAAEEDRQAAQVE